jgi:chemotaxis signal transduction protein
MILLKTGGSQAKIALVVDELGEIPSLPVTALNESENLTTQGNIIQALVKTSNNLLVVLNTEQLLKQLEQGIKKAPQRTKGLFPEALAR